MDNIVKDIKQNRVLFDALLQTYAKDLLIYISQSELESILFKITQKWVIHKIIISLTCQNRRFKCPKV